jgi:nitronate monooxygenase
VKNLQLSAPIVQAPMAGGPSTPELAAAVSNAGGLGFVAAGYLTPEALSAAIQRTRALTSRAFGVNVFVPGAEPASPAVVQDYAARLEPESQRAGVALGAPRFDDDHYQAKLDLLAANPAAIVSFTFGCPDPAVIARLQGAGAAVWVTITTPDEAQAAVAAGADALVVQGVEAGGHRASFDDRAAQEQFGLLALLQLVQSRVAAPLIAAGGIATGQGVAAVLAAGAEAAAIGTAFMRCREAVTSPMHRAALASTTSTDLTRAFTGRLARGIVNRFMTEHSADAPSAYPETHYLTAPLRAHGRQTGGQDLVNLWAGQAHALGQEMAAADLVAQLTDEARRALGSARQRLGEPG